MKKATLILGMIVISMIGFSQSALIKSYEWKRGFTANYWVPISVTYDNVQNTTSVCMGLFKDASMYNAVKDSANVMQENILSRRDGFYLSGHVEETAIPAAIKAYTGPSYNRPPMGMGNSIPNFFSNAVIQ